MDIQQQALLQKTIDYIEDHIKEEINPEELAKMAGYSPYHFYRFFRNAIGYTVMDYVLKRKLQYALYELVNGKKIIQIAFEYGFETHAGFTKAFKRCFGSPPSLYRRYCPISLPPKLNLFDLSKKNLRGIVLQPMIVGRQAFQVAGQTFECHMKNVAYTRDAPAFWDQEGLNDGSVERALYELLSPKKHGEYCINLSMDTHLDQFTYLFAVNLDQEIHLPDGFMKFEIPASTYAIFKTPPVGTEHFVPAIKGTWRYILEDWLPHSSYEVDEKGYDFEYYDEHCHYWDHEKIYMEIHLPIKEKTRG
ncbi:AraC family transcriptional regulator [Cytobacillus depressus]|uniref:AraC family transcriptional regulator n=1 Tax=Cytobacillus depressus TaxID=1602942 RepID=A0A6L3V5R7_9BACI|nr:AraC family transcriptional regulator [Cytobacillus depressus]KAB2334583.1 AraC family transcriptional regulator [Cytobacillus depressus]